MAKEKLTLSDIKIESCVTSLNVEQMKKVKGGLASIQGRRLNYTIRWTAVETRAQSDLQSTNVRNGGIKG